MINELEILEHVNNPFIAQVIELLHDSQNVYIVTELVSSGDLFDYLKKKDELCHALMTEFEAKYLAKQLFTVLHYLHKSRIVHRDIKLENILVDVSGNDIRLKLIDFGFSTFIQEKGKLSKGLGSRYYFAPEILNKRDYDERVDVWSAAVIIFCLLFGEMPFPGADVSEVAANIKNRNLDEMLYDTKFDLSPSGRDFIKMGLRINPSKRGTAKQMLDHPWLRGVPVPKPISTEAISSTEALLSIRAGQKLTQKQTKDVVETLLEDDNKFCRDLNYSQLCTKLGK